MKPTINSPDIQRVIAVFLLVFLEELLIVEFVIFGFLFDTLLRMEKGLIPFP